MIKKRVFNRIMSVSVICVLCLSLSFCGKSTMKIESEYDSPEESDIMLSITSMYGEGDVFRDAYKSLTEEFMAENPGVTVLDESATATEEWKQKVAQGFAVGDESDVVCFFTDANADNLMAADKFVTIDEIRSVYPDYAKDTKESAFEQVKAADGKCYAVPTLGYWEGLYCNKDLFERYGAKLPSTWDDLKNAVAVFKENGIVPITVSLSEQPHYLLEFLLMYYSGKEIYESVPEKVPREWIEGTQLMKTLYDMGAFPEDSRTLSYFDAKELFLTKKAAMIVEGSWFLGTIPDQTRTVVCDFPIPPGGKAWIKTIISGFSSGFYITKKAWNDEKKRDAAVKLVEKFTGKEGVERFWKAGGCVSATAVDLEEPAGLTPLEASAAKYVRLAGVTCTPTDSRISGLPWAKFISDIPAIAAGEMSAEESLKRMLDAHNQ